jgi:hypothetical protein
VKNRENRQKEMPPFIQDKPRRSLAPPLIAKAALATILLIGAMATAGYALSGGIGQHGDEVTPSEQQTRLEAFNALGPLRLSAVSAEDIDHAVQGMQLTSAAAAALKANLASTSLEPAPTALAEQAKQRTGQQTPQPAAVQPRRQRVRLVWITLFDTDVEDGDVVRIDSQGYSRTVKLTTKGDTFAVPVTANGVIQVTGISDGDGGGITVGLASGSAKAVFPVMSEGQVLGLKATVN